MIRSGYTDDADELDIEAYREEVSHVIREPSSQAFLRELATAMDAMPVKELITDELVTADGKCCAIGVVCKARGLDVSGVDVECPDDVGCAVGISEVLAAEIEYLNDEVGYDETEMDRWERMRRWVNRNLHDNSVA